MQFQLVVPKAAIPRRQTGNEKTNKSETLLGDFRSRGSPYFRGERSKAYGTEYTTLYTSGNIKFVRYNDSKSAKTPKETMTRGRIYVTVNDGGKLIAITYYDNDNKKRKQIDLDKYHKGMKPHTHHGYEHHEKDSKKGAARLTTEEKRMVERVTDMWYNKKGR